MIDDEYHQHQNLMLTDIYKLYMQSIYGPGHIIRDKESAKEYLQIELSQKDDYISKYQANSENVVLHNYKDKFKTISNNEIICPCIILTCNPVYSYIRLSLQVIKDKIVSFNDFFDSFIYSVEVQSSITEDEFIANWFAIYEKISEKYNINKIKEEANFIKINLLRRNFLFSHSKEYHQNYFPSYRIINLNYIDKYYEKILDFYYK
jgi:hypothetical protein